MATATESTEWPTVEISSEGRALLNLFFALTESKSEDAGPRLAHEVFAADGKFITPRRAYTGTAGKSKILRSKDRRGDRYC